MQITSCIQCYITNFVDLVNHYLPWANSIFPHECRGSVGVLFFRNYNPASTKLMVDILVSCCASTRLSVCGWISVCSISSMLLARLIIVYTTCQPASSGLSRGVVFVLFQNLDFGFFIFNFDIIVDSSSEFHCSHCQFSFIIGLDDLPVGNSELDQNINFLFLAYIFFQVCLFTVELKIIPGLSFYCSQFNGLKFGNVCILTTLRTDLSLVSVCGFSSLW